jgi:hypothetical protein
MATICAWCNKAVKPALGEETINGTSHGMCQSCCDKMMKEMEEMKKREEGAIKEKSIEPNFPIK